MVNEPTRRRSRPEVVVITGASAGVGRALTRACGARGAYVGLIARGPDGLEAAQLEIEQAGGQGLVCPADGSRIKVTMVQLPAVNTPQFDWVKSRLPNRAQPVPPVFQSEVAAEAIMWAADRGRREMNVGMPTVTAIVGNKLAPGLLDRYLARIGYAAQQTDQPADPDRADNLWTPLPGDHGAHGRFDSVAHRASTQLWLSQHRGAAGRAIASLALSVVGVWRVAGGRRLDRLRQPAAAFRAV